LQKRTSRAANQPEAPSQRRTLIEYRAPQQHEVPVTPVIPQTPDQRGTLPWAYANRHSPEMNSALKAAGDHVRNGFNLAQRNALYLAQAEFIAALELVAEANDVQQNTRFYTDALNAGLLALAESSDFVQRRPVGRRLDIARIVSGHKTPILKTPPHNRLAPTLAAERYNSYAREQLAAASAMQSDASMALLGLGKVAIAQGTTNPAQRLESTVKATTLYQAALMADSGNFGAANELGVIQARRGELAQARDLLVHSVQLAPHPATHRNLAAVYEKLGQTQLAEQAKSQAVDLEQAGYRRSGPAVQWLDPAAFANTAPATDSLLPPATGPTTLPGAETPPRADEKAATTAKRGLTDWLPWTIRR
jgi:tetratricopeptide (TPR) repeat protein